MADVWTGRAEAELSLGRLGAYLAFFPKLLQGPFERATAFLPQLDRLGLPAPEAQRAAIWLFG